MPKRVEPHFFGRNMCSNGLFYQLNMLEGLSVCCWLDGQTRWKAQLQTIRPMQVLIEVSGKTPRDALRKLERRSLSLVRAMVKSITAAMAAVGDALRLALAKQ